MVIMRMVVVVMLMMVVVVIKRMVVVMMMAVMMIEIIVNLHQKRIFHYHIHSSIQITIQAMLVKNRYELIIITRDRKLMDSKAKKQRSTRGSSPRTRLDLVMKSSRHGAAFHH